MAKKRWHWAKIVHKTRAAALKCIIILFLLNLFPSYRQAGRHMPTFFVSVFLSLSLSSYQGGWKGHNLAFMLQFAKKKSWAWLNFWEGAKFWSGLVLHWVHTPSSYLRTMAKTIFCTACRTVCIFGRETIWALLWGKSRFWSHAVDPQYWMNIVI